MSTAVATMDRLPVDSNVKAWQPAARALMQQLGLVDRKDWRGPQPDAPAGVIEAFLIQSRRTGLDPAARQIYAVEMGGKWNVLISIDGFRLIADRTGKYRGKQPTMWCGEDGVWKDVWLSSEPPAAAKVTILRSDFDEPVVAVATYAGYCPRDKKSGELKPSGQWQFNASNQLAKCAEMLALRQAYPNELSGLYGTEEMDQAAPAPVERPAPVQEPVAASRDWFADGEAVATVEGLRDLYREAAAVGALNVTRDGVTVAAFLTARADELNNPEPVEDVVDAEVVEDDAAEPVTEWPVAEIPGADEAQPVDESEEPF